jgi:integrase
VTPGVAVRHAVSAVRPLRSMRFMAGTSASARVSAGRGRGLPRRPALGVCLVDQFGEAPRKVRETKTKNKRVIPVTGRAAAVLREHRARMEEQGQDVESGFVFVTRNGRPQSKHNVFRAWRAALDRIAVKANLHSLRHSFISRHAERDTPVVLVSDLVGHARVTTTQVHYTRVRGGEKQRIDSLRAAL